VSPGQLLVLYLATHVDLMTHNNGSQEELIELVEMEISRIRFQWTAGTLPPSKYMPWWNAQEHSTNQP
jgi:hypothetical protein